MSLVKDFGAVGDGQADDTAAIQHAVEQADGLLEFSRGRYRITQPIVLDLARHGPMGIRGGNGTATIEMAGAGPAFHLLGNHSGTAHPKTIEPRISRRERFPIISGIEIVGDHDEAEGIRVQKTLQAIVSEVLIRGCRYGIRLVERNRNFIMTHCQIFDNREVGVFFDAVNIHQINIIGNHISYNRKAGIFIRNGEVRNLQITGNDIEYNDDEPGGSADLWIDTTDGTLREMTIASNTIQGEVIKNGANIRIIGAPAETSNRSGLIAITGNLVGSQHTNIELSHTRGLTITGNSLYSAAELSIHARSCRNLVISGNSIDINPGVEDRMKDGIRLDDCHGCTMVGMAMEDCAYGDDAAGGAVTIIGCTDVAVSGSHILDPRFRGIYLEKSQRCRITDNTIVDRRQPGQMLAAIEVGEECRHLAITRNLIAPGARGGILPVTPEATDNLWIEWGK